MPFQSEKQRRYLWANEPEIAREWTNRYGASQGGLTRLPLRLGTEGEEMIAMGTPLTNQMAKVMQKDIDASKMSGFKNQDYESYKNQMELLGGTKVTPYEFKGLQEGTITEPGNYKKEASLNDPYAGIEGYTAESPLIMRDFDFDVNQGGISAFQDDYNYTPRNTMGNWSQFDDAESEWNAAQGFEDADAQAAYTDYASGLPTLKKQWNFPDVNLSNVGDAASGVWALANDAMPWGWAKRGWDTLTSGFSGGEPRDPNLGRGLSGNVSWMGSRYDKEHGVGSYRDKNIMDWQRKYGHIEKKTAEGKKKREWFRKEAERIQKEKADAAKAAAAANRRKVEQYTGRPMSDYRSSRPASERQFTGHGKSGMGRSADRFA